MDLKLCPSCGQSVLDDDAKECPFCGASMDGSGKGGRKPTAGKQAGISTAATRANKPNLNSESASSPGSGSKPVPSGMKPLKPKTDEDDPFGLGAVRPQATAIQALQKPAKGVLHRVICPMCEKPGFVPKSAIGKQVRCANEKCMVPIFTVPDPNAPVADKVPRRRQPLDTELQSEKAKAGQPGSPMLIYGIVGSIVLGLGGGLAWYLNQPPATPADLSKPVDIPIGGYEPDPAEIEAARKAEEKKKAAEAAAKSPTREAERIAKRMIQTARQSANRDKAYARRLTGDVYLHTGNTAAAAQEFAQMLSVDRQSGYYQIEPHLQAYWRQRVDGDSAGAKNNFAIAMQDVNAIPTSGRLGLETAMAVASVLMVEGKADEAEQLIQKMQRDDSVIQNRDAMASAAWFFTTNALRSNHRSAIPVSDVFAWNNPLRTAVAADLACRSQLKQAIEWSLAGEDKREIADSLAIVAELAAATKASNAELQQIETAAATAHPMAALRVKAIIATERKQAELLAECKSEFAAIPGDTPPLSIPPIADAIRMKVKSGDEERVSAAALTEYVRAAVACGDQALAEEGVRKLVSTMFQIAPPTAETRKAVLEVEQRENDIKRRIKSEMRISAETQVTSTFRNYRRKIDQLAVTAEERRLTLMHRLARIVRGGGVPAIQTVFDDPANGLRQEVMVDGLSGLLGAAATRVGTSFSASEGEDASLRVPLPNRTDALHEIRVSPLLVRAWQLGKNDRLPNALQTLGTGSTDLPGLREAVLNEVVHFAALKAKTPEAVYKAVGILANPVWREEALQTAGRVFVERRMEKEAEAWLESENRMPPTEQVCAFYALAAGIADRIEEDKAE